MVRVHGTVEEVQWLMSVLNLENGAPPFQSTLCMIQVQESNVKFEALEKSYQKDPTEKKKFIFTKDKTLVFSGSR